MPTSEIALPWLASFYSSNGSALELADTYVSKAMCAPPGSPLTAFNSPRLPDLAKWAVSVAFELPAATPQRARMMLAVLSTMMRSGFGNAGDRQSAIMAASLNMSAARR